MVPVKTFQIQPPAAFTADQLRQDEAVEFSLTGSPGQMLRVRVAQPYRVRVRLPENGSELAWGGDSTGNWFYALPKAGTYRVLYAPWKTTPGIQFDFLADNDPLADPGVKAEQIDVDFGPFARKEDLVITPLDLNYDSEDYLNSWPTHLAVGHPDFEFRIMTVAGNKAVFKKNERMTALETAIRAHGKGANVEKLPYSVYRGGGVQLWMRPEFVEEDGWHGLRWIGAFAQDMACGPDMGGQELSYYFEAISNDGRYFILLRARISSAALAGRFDKDCAAAVDEVRNPDLKLIFQKDIAAAGPASFQPNLDQLDAVIRSLKLQP